MPTVRVVPESTCFLLNTFTWSCKHKFHTSNSKSDSLEWSISIKLCILDFRRFRSIVELRVFDLNPMPFSPSAEPFTFDEDHEFGLFFLSCCEKIKISILILKLTYPEHHRRLGLYAEFSGFVRRSSFIWFIQQFMHVVFIRYHCSTISFVLH